MVERIRELYDRHVPAGVRDIVSTTLTGAAIGAGTAFAGKIFQRIGAMPNVTDMPPNPSSPAGGYTQREQYRRSGYHQGQRQRF